MLAAVGHLRLPVERVVQASAGGVAAEVGRARDADADAAVLRFEARQPRLERPVVVHDRAVNATDLDLLGVACVEDGVAGAGPNAQPIERRCVGDDRAAHHLYEAVAAHVVEAHVAEPDARHERAAAVVLNRDVPLV